MPEVVVHAVFGREVRKNLDSGIAERIRDVSYTFALFGPDIWFMYEPWKRREGRGRRMHTMKTGAFLTELARQAKELGCELFVLDDGWFRERNNDLSGLGNYETDTDKLPDGLEGLADRIRETGLAFGLWVEPESVSAESELSPGSSTRT